ncbi:MAG: BspA family leucine-rich repeat surface protein [Lachnospiraceae bacterium]|nr:BspA family leucine-rich repeat surface protein [Lachnospiraceae bacterium]
MQQTRCINCMKEIAPGTRICPYCGYDRQTEQMPSALRPDTILRGRYLVGRVIGRGGFGITYVGLDLTLEMKVAIKEYYPSGIASRNNSWSNQVVWDSVSQNQDARAQRADSMERVLKEARRTAKLSDVSSIVSVHDAFQENETAYIVMEFIEGTTLKDYLASHGMMSWEECKQMLFPVMDGLAQAHDLGIIHRDISPDNIIIRPDGTAKLLDLGAAVDVSANDGHASTLVVKNNFSAAEQYDENGKIGSWTDVYAFAAMLYYCLTGKLMVPVIDRMMTQKALTFPAQPEVPEQVKNALKKALEVDQENRIPDMRAFKRALMEDTGGQSASAADRMNVDGAGARPASGAGGTHKSKKTTVVIVGVLCAVALVGVVIFALQSAGIFDGDNQSNHKISVENEDKNGTEATEKAAEVMPEGNILVNDYDSDSGEVSEYVFGSDWKRSEITAITVLDTLEDEPEDSWDVSAAGDGSVKAWVSTADGYHLYLAGEGGVAAPEDCSYLFAEYNNVKSIELADAFFTQNTVNMCGMFENCREVTAIDVVNFDTANVTNMSDMFHMCMALTSLDVSGFDTSQVTDMSSAFCYCTELTELDVSNFDTANVTDMSEMFDNCAKVQVIDVSGFDTSNVTDMSYMFSLCASVRELDVSGFDTSQVTNMACMFDFAQGCSLTELDITGFDTSQVTNMRCMFLGCTASDLLVDDFDTSNVTDMFRMFKGCTQIGTLNVAGFDTSKVTTMEEMFSGCESLLYLNLAGFDVSNITEDDWSIFLTDCDSLEILLLWEDISDELKIELYEQAGLATETSGITASQTAVTVNISDVKITDFEIEPSTFSRDTQSISHSVGADFDNEEVVQVSFTSVGGTDSSVTVTSSDTSVVVVTDVATEGNVTTVTLRGLSESFSRWSFSSTRTATITATANDGSGVSCSVDVTVKQSISYTITSSDDSVFHFNYNDDGTVTGFSAPGTGTVVLTLTTKNGNTATTTITVTD